MRRLLFAIILCVLCPAFALASGQDVSFVMSAQQIALYADRGLLIADGGVSIHRGAMQITATRASYDLRASRLTSVGDVTVKDAAGTSSGAAYIFDAATGHGTFVSSAVVPQLSLSEALATGSQVELRPGSSITFTNAQVRSGSTLTPQASYLYVIPPPAAKDFGYSPVPSAALEWPFLLTNSSNGYTFARARYDRYNGGPGSGLEEHYARSGRGYVALGETMDVDGARYDLGSYQRLNDHLSQTLTGSSLYGAHALRYALASTGRRGYAALSFTQFNAMRSDDLLFTSNQHPLWGLGSFRTQVDFGHDVHPGDARVAQDWRVTPGVHFDTATVHVGSSSLSASVDLGENVYDYGRGTLASSATLWGTFPATRRLQFTAGATFSHNAPPFPSTFRTYNVGYTWKASDAFNLVSSLTYTHDYGQVFGFGRPLFSAAFDVLVRRKNGRGIEVGALVPFGGLGNKNRQAGLNLRLIR